MDKSCIVLEAADAIGLQGKPEYRPKPNIPQHCLKDIKVKKARKYCGCIDACEGTHGDPPQPGRVRSVSPIKKVLAQYSSDGRKKGNAAWVISTTVSGSPLCEPWESARS